MHVKYVSQHQVSASHCCHNKAANATSCTVPLHLTELSAIMPPRQDNLIIKSCQALARVVVVLVVVKHFCLESYKCTPDHTPATTP